MLSGNKVDSKQADHLSWISSRNASRYVLWLLFTFPQCTVSIHVPTFLVFRLISTSLPSLDNRLNVQQLSGYCLTPIHLALYPPGLCAMVLKHISGSDCHHSSTSDSSRALGWMPSSSGLLRLVLRFCSTTSSIYGSLWDRSFSMSRFLSYGSLPRPYRSEKTYKHI